MLDFVDLLHRLDRLVPQLAIVLDRDVAPLLELEARVDRQLLRVRLAVRLGPADLARVLLFVERTATLGPTESEHLTGVGGKKTTMPD